jgi:hypothetical protein
MILNYVNISLCSFNGVFNYSVLGKGSIPLGLIKQGVETIKNGSLGWRIIDNCTVQCTLYTTCVSGIGDTAVGDERE